MSSSLSYQFHPQPPSHPKTTGAKRGPSDPLSIASSSSEDEDSDLSISGSPPIGLTRHLTHDHMSNNANTLTSVLSLANISSPRSHITNKKTGLLPSPRSINNNNVATINLNSGSNNSHHNYCLNTSTNNSSITTPSLPNSGFSSGSHVSTTPNPLSLPLSLQQSPSHIVPQTTSLNTNNSNLSTINTPALSPTASVTLTNNNGGINNNSNACSHDSSKENNSPSSTPRDRSLSPGSSFAYEHDHDYENVASPCSSTASGPIYVRPPGFQHHAQEIIAKNKIKKKKTSATLISLKEGFKKRDPTPPKVKPKREPLPMKLRALPQSFWQQPNVAQQVSPASNFPILPPLCNKDIEEVMDVRPVTPPEDKDEIKRQSPPERKLTVANTDLLFKLFEGIGDDKKASSQPKSRQLSRQRKPIHKSNKKGLFLGNDPYMMEAVSEKIFPQLTLEGTKQCSGGGGTSLQLITLREGVTLPSLGSEHNYSQMLSELVMHI